VVVVPPGVLRDLIGGRGAARRGRRRVAVAFCYHDDRACAREDKLGVGTSVGVFGKPAHFSGLSLLKPVQKRVSVRGPDRWGEAAGLKAQLGRVFPDGLLQGDGFHAKACLAAVTSASTAAVCCK
jgi:hypothetical protein